MKRKSDDFLENKENEEKDDGTAAADTQISGQSGSDKEALGKEPIGKLLFRLAVPTVAAQLINMLYNIVDRIYIGHIPEIGATALTGVGVCMPLIMIVSAFAALVGYGGAPRASIFMGKQDKEFRGKNAGKLFCRADYHFCNSHSGTTDPEPGFSDGVWRQQQYHRLCGRLYEYLCVGHNFC